MCNNRMSATATNLKFVDAIFASDTKRTAEHFEANPLVSGFVCLWRWVCVERVIDAQQQDVCNCNQSEIC